MKWVEKYRSKIIRFTFGDVNIDNLHYPIRFGDRRELNVHIHFNMREKLNWISAKNFCFHFVCGAFVLCQIWFKIVFVPFIIATAADAPWRVAANAAYAAFCKQIRKPTKNLLFFFRSFLFAMKAVPDERCEDEETKKSISKMHIYLGLHCERIELTCIY